MSLAKVACVDEDLQEKNVYQNGDEFNLLIDWHGQEMPKENMYISFRIDSERLQAVTGLEAFEKKYFLSTESILANKGRVLYRIPQLHLGEGRYFISVSLCRHILPKGKEAIVHYVEKATTFSVVRNSAWHLAYVYEPGIEFQEL